MQITAFFFQPGMDVDAAKDRYRALSRVLHPDTGTGDTALMQRLNAEFDALTAGRLLPGDVWTSPRPAAGPKPPPDDRADRLRKAAEATIAEMPAFPRVRIVYDPMQRRIIARGDTYPVKDELRAYGFRWDADRRHWWIGVYI